jgi:hypothetical protein
MYIALAELAVLVVRVKRSHCCSRSAPHLISGLATTFVNESDIGIVKELRSLLNQSQQAVPDFLKELLFR